MAVHTLILKNTTSSGITLPDLAGLYIPAFDTRDISELFTTSKLEDTPILHNYITNSGIVLNVDNYDFSPTRATRFLSAHDATSIQGYPLGNDMGTTEIYTTGEKIAVLRYDPAAQIASFSGIALSDLDDITIIGGNYYITNDYGDSPLVQDFTTLGDTPTTYSGAYGYLLQVTASGIIFVDPLGEVDFAYFRYVEDNEATYSTITTYVNKISLTVSGVADGVYRASWYYEYNYPTSSFAMFTRVQVDNSEVMAEVAQRALNSADWFSSSGFAYFTVASGIARHIDLDYRSDKINNAAGIRRARLEVRRIEMAYE